MKTAYQKLGDKSHWNLDKVCSFFYVTIVFLFT
jgi:hypothetical protein